jgi:hypothetical protein
MIMLFTVTGMMFLQEDFYDSGSSNLGGGRRGRSVVNGLSEFGT